MATTTLITAVAQGSADAFAQGTINTGLSGSDNSAFRVIGMLVELPTFVGITGNQEVEFSIARASKAAMPLLSDDDVVFKFKRRLNAATSGVAVFDLVEEIVPENEILLIESQIYVQFDTAATTATNSLVLRLIVEDAKVTTDQRIAILQSRIN